LRLLFHTYICLSTQINNELISTLKPCFVLYTYQSNYQRIQDTYT